MMTQQVFKMRQLGLDVGDMFAVLTDKHGQPRQYVHRTCAKIFAVISQKPGMAPYTMPAQASHTVQDLPFLAMVARDLGLTAEEAPAGFRRLQNRCNGHDRKRTWRMDGLRFFQPQASWCAGDGVVIVDTQLFDDAWVYGDDYYIGNNELTGSGGAERKRYNQLVEWLKKTAGRKPIEMPEVSLDVVQTSGVPRLSSGRRLFAVLRDMGYEKLPVSVDVYSQGDVEKLYGAR